VKILAWAKAWAVALFWYGKSPKWVREIAAHRRKMDAQAEANRALYGQEARQKYQTALANVYAGAVAREKEEKKQEDWAATCAAFEQAKAEGLVCDCPKEWDGQQWTLAEWGGHRWHFAGDRCRRCNRPMPPAPGVVT